MSDIYPHRRHGWQIIYSVFFPDKTYYEKTKYRKNKQDELVPFHDAEKLDVASGKRCITREEVILATKVGLLTNKEALKISPSLFIFVS